MIETHTFLDKCNTLMVNSDINYGLNPMVELYYGYELSRGIIHFDTDKVKQLVDNKTYPDITKLRHRLKMVNTANFEANEKLNRPFPDLPCTDLRQRAISFDLIFFLVPKDWDCGRGFDSDTDLHQVIPSRAVSTKPSNWFYATSVHRWDKPGMFSLEDYETSYYSGHQNLEQVPFIIGRQHFDYGNEDIDIDITDVFNKFMSGEYPNYGIGIAFQPELEATPQKISQYVGFFSNTTNGFYEPYIETRYDDCLSDDRVDFYLDKENRLYFYATAGGQSIVLDNLPTVMLNDKEYTAKMQTRGVYYIDVMLSSEEYEPETMYYDVWTNLNYKGRHITDSELYFTTKASNGYFTFGLPYETKYNEKFVPSVYGIKQNESVCRGDIRKVNIDCKIQYTKKQIYPTDNIEYRLYILDGQREYDVINWSKVDRGYNTSYFMIDTESLLPADYYVDIRIKYDMEEIIHHKQLKFTVINNMTETHN